MGTLALAQGTGQAHCSYFVTLNWSCSYPGQFSAEFKPKSGRLLVTPVPGSFAGITSVAVFTDLDCGSQPLCSHQFPVPVTAQTEIPQAWWDCALAAQPLYIKICWKEKPVAEAPAFWKE
jgi:hypothetical protein